MAANDENQVGVVPGAIQKSATPWLTTAPGLIHSLGICTAFASTPQVASITLTRPGIKSTDLSTNLVHIADQGQNAFMDAYTDLLDISNGTRAMSRDNGYFDRLEEAIGKPEGERAATRAMERITETIKDCDRNGKRTERQFKEWHRTVQTVRLAVIETQKTTQAGSKHVADQMRELNDQLTLQEVSMNQTITQVRNAQEEYRRVLHVHRQREAALNSYTQHAVTCATLGVTAGMFGAMLGAAGSAAMLAFSGDRASSLEAQLQQKMSMGYELEMQMQHVRNGLTSLEDDKEQLAKMAGIIVVVCRILQGLCADIVQLVHMFAHLNGIITQLIQDYKGAKDIAAGIREDMEDAEDDGVEARISKRDYDQFRDQVHEMRRLTVMIHSMSTLYADVIADVITPGFSKVVETAYEDYGETNVSMIVYNKEKGMKDYLLEAERACQAREKEADGKLSTRMQEIEAAFEARSLNKRSKPKFKKEGSSRSNGRGQGGFFSRIF